MLVPFVLFETSLLEAMSHEDDSVQYNAGEIRCSAVSSGRDSLFVCFFVCLFVCFGFGCKCHVLDVPISDANVMSCCGCNVA